MLVNLSIKNFVLIDSINISFGHRLSVLTGETGAGKSILLDALSIALGGKTDISSIKNGKDSASISAIFELSKNHEAFTILKENDIDFDQSSNELILRRTLNKTGKSRAYINDIPVSKNLLSQVGQTLIEIHGQFDNHSLLNTKTHKSILDNFGKYIPSIQKVKENFLTWTEKKKELQIRQEALEKAKEDEDYLRHNVDELTVLAPQSGEEEELTNKRKSLMNAEKITSSVKDAIASLNRYGAEPDKHIREALYAIDRIDESAKDSLLTTINDLEDSAEKLSSASYELEKILNNINDSTEELEQTEERLFTLKATARKHNCQVDELPSVLENLSKTLSDINNSDENLQILIKEEQSAKENYISYTKELSSLREQTGLNLSNAINSELPPLKLEKAQFEVQITELPEDKWNESGIDDILFIVSTNPGMPKDLIQKVASGGELARFMLAIKVVLSEVNPVSSMVFDEVDTGISGSTASAVGQRLLKLSRSIQIMVVTHSAQVAAFGTHHFKVSKSSSKEDGIETISTNIQHLSNDERRSEIARIISSDEITNEALSQADNLLNKANTLL